MNFTRTDHMQLLPHMQDVGSDIMDEILKERANYKPEIYTEADVKAALNAKHCSLENLKVLLSPATAPFLEQIAQLAQAKTRANFGSNITLFTPLYIANYCDNLCVYCGFNANNKIKRAKLSDEEITRELREISKITRANLASSFSLKEQKGFVYDK